MRPETQRAANRRFRFSLAKDVERRCKVTILLLVDYKTYKTTRDTFGATSVPVEKNAVASESPTRVIQRDIHGMNAIHI